MKIATGDWCSKLKEDNIEALLSIKVEDPGIEGFIKKHTSDAAVFWQDAEKRRKERNGMQKNIRNVLERLNNLGLQANSWIPFLKAAVIKMKAMLFSTSGTVRHHWCRIKNQVNNLR